MFHQKKSLNLFDIIVYHMMQAAKRQNGIGLKFLETESALCLNLLHTVSEVLIKIP
jgi:hypothetical protein